MSILRPKLALALSSRYRYWVGVNIKNEGKVGVNIKNEGKAGVNTKNEGKVGVNVRYQHRLV